MSRLFKEKDVWYDKKGLESKYTADKDNYGKFWYIETRLII